jgi:nucleoside-triphosphatase THEP1
VLQDMPDPPPASLAPAIASRIKLLSHMNIAERRLPQDGRIMTRVKGHELDLRVSTIPTVHGESIVMRVLDRESIRLSLADMGFSEDTLPATGAAGRPHGVLLVTGPTGSGKTTTLYASLASMDASDRKIITVEDPVEYQLPGVNQIQVQSQIDLTFARALRAILRQDPDIIMIGEMRDTETAQIGVQSALTGHLVLSTLHTNTAAGAITRLEDMGIERYLITSSVNGVLAQRLLRTLCTALQASPWNCPIRKSRSTGSSVSSTRAARTVYRARGCDRVPAQRLRRAYGHSRAVPPRRGHPPGYPVRRRCGAAARGGATPGHDHALRGRPAQGGAGRSPPSRKCCASRRTRAKRCERRPCRRRRCSEAPAAAGLTMAVLLPGGRSRWQDRRRHPGSRRAGARLAPAACPRPDAARIRAEGAGGASGAVAGGRRRARTCCR